MKATERQKNWLLHYMKDEIQTLMPEHTRTVTKQNGEILNIDLRQSDFRSWADKYLSLSDASKIIQLYQTGNENGASKTLEHLLSKYA